MADFYLCSAYSDLSQNADCPSRRFSWLTSALNQHGNNTFKWVRATSFPLYSSLVYISFHQSWDNSVGVATDYRLDGQGIRIQLPAGARDFSLLYIVQTSCGAHPSCVLGVISRELQRQGHQADRSPPFSAKVKKTWINTSTVPYVFMVWWLIEHRATSSLVVSSDVT